MAGFDLQRFARAQADVYPCALAELQAGHKQSHWMWFVFPQIAGLGSSTTARRYAIVSAGEARAYLAHPLLRARLREGIEAVLTHRGCCSAEAIFGGVDAMKFRSSMTLFEAVADEPEVFAAALDAFYNGDRDPATLRILGR